MKQYIIAHDLGTSGNKATLFTADGAMVGSTFYGYETIYLPNNGVEQNPDDWWQAVCETTKELVDGIDVTQVAAISFSGQMMGAVCVDEQGVPLRNCLIWADMRATEEEQMIREKISDKEFYDLTGHRISPSYGGQKLMWVKNNEPEIYAKTYKLLNAKDYILYKLTGNFVTEYTDASSTCLLDLSKLEWSGRLIDVMGLDADKLPELHASTDVVGHLSAAVAEATGLAAGTPVVAGGGDGVCAAVGTGCVKEGVAHSCLGTSSWISITAKEPIYDENMQTFTWAHIVPGYVLPTGTMQCGGGAYAWYTKNFCRYEKQVAEEQGGNMYDLLEEELQGSAPGANGLIFLPYLMGERSPRWNPKAKGGFIGLDIKHDYKDMLRSVQEGVAMNLSVILDVFEAHDQQIDEIIAIGGGAKSPTWGQILADNLKTDITVPDIIDEATSMGAAITAGVGVGLFENFDVIDRFLKMQDTYRPNPDNFTVYENQKELFNEIYAALEPTFNKMI